MAGGILLEDGSTFFELEDGSGWLLMENGSARKVSAMPAVGAVASNDAFPIVGVDPWLVGVDPWPVGLAPTYFWEFTGTPGDIAEASYTDSQNGLVLTANDPANIRVAGGPVLARPQVRGLQLNVNAAQGVLYTNSAILDNLSNNDFTISLFWEGWPVNGVPTFPRLWSKLDNFFAGYELGHVEFPDDWFVQTGNGAAYAFRQTPGIVTSPFGPGTYRYMTLVFTAATGAIQVYVNGVLFYSNSVPIPLATSSVDFVVGGFSDRTSERTLGTVAQIGIWQRALAQPEIMAAMAVVEYRNEDVGTEQTSPAQALTSEGVAPLLLGQRTIPTRAFTTIYQNNTGYALKVTAAALFTGASGTVTAEIGASSPPTQLAASYSVSGVSYATPVVFIVPPGYFYRITTTGTGPSIYNWAESPIFGG